MKNIAGKTVLLTGASGGIGAFIAHALAKEQATVVGVARCQQKLEQIQVDIEANGGKFISIPFDISKVEDLSILVQQINQHAGSVDILINNAAIEKFHYFQHYSLSDINSMCSVNLIAAIELTRLLLPSMIDRNRGHIISIASGSGKKGMPYNSVYSATKAGLLVWTDSMRQELNDCNVKISVVCPGYTNAGMFLRTGLVAPKVANVTEPSEVALAIIRAIKENQTEVIIDGFVSKLLFAINQLSPKFGDAVFRLTGVTDLYKSYVESQYPMGNTGN